MKILEGRFEIVSVYIYIKGSGWTLLENGFGGLCAHDSLCFERISDNEYWVSYLEPDNHQFKLKIKSG